MKKEQIKSSTISFFKTYGVFLLILIPLIIGVSLRVAPADLDITDTWAKQTTYSNLENQMKSEARQAYPNLESTYLQAEADRRFDAYLLANEDKVNEQIKSVSQYYKSAMQDDDGQTYLLAIDPWLFYGNAKYYVENGAWGEDIYNDGDLYYPYRNGRFGKGTHFQMLPAMNVVTYNVWHFFDKSVSVMKATFYLPVLIAIVFIILAFMIGLKISGKFGAVVAATIIASHIGLLRRTSAGFVDTDNLIILGEMLTMFFFVMAYDEEKSWKQILYGIGLALSMAFYTRSHSSWWHMYDMFVAVLGISIIYILWNSRKELKKNFKDIFKIEAIRSRLRLLVTFIVGSSIFGTLSYVFLSGTDFVQSVKIMVLTPFTGPFTFIQLKDVGLKTVWPNVMTTVAELNTSNLTDVFSTLGGTWLVLISLVGCLYLVYKGFKANGIEDRTKYLVYGSFLVMWLIASIYASQSSIRFVAFAVPAFAFGIGAFASMVLGPLVNWGNEELNMNKIALSVVFILLLGSMVYIPIVMKAQESAIYSTPTMNDAWYKSLEKIKLNDTDGIITSWWDFGHWFVSVAERKVTFDGGDQGERIYWVGKSLLTDSETETLGILKMLNCGQEQAPHALEDAGYSTRVAVEIINNIIMMDKDKAREYLTDLVDDPEEILKYTHCDDLIPQYYIVSEDMVGKAGVWGHFGSWDFEKATMFNSVKRMNQDKGISYLTSEFELSEDQAMQTYNTIKSKKGDDYIAPWPGYITSASCSVSGGYLNCGNLAKINNTDLRDITVNFPNLGIGKPHSLVYLDGAGYQELEYDSPELDQVSLFLVPFNDQLKVYLVDPILAQSTFTKLFFFRGVYSECFDLLSYERSFSNNEILVYKVDWDCHNKLLSEE